MEHIARAVTKVPYFRLFNTLKFKPPAMSIRMFALWVLLGILPQGVFAIDPPVDNSRADTDGPHVFYRGKNIIVKSVERIDTLNMVRMHQYNKRDQVLLSCTLPQSGDKFSFPLKEKLRVEKFEYAQPARMLVLSDIEGNFEAFKLILRGAKVIDTDFKWTFGTGHLVLVGDFFDRGLNVTECLWLVYKLESEAEAAGGKVHFILGNHEVMNLTGYFDYVRKKYIENAELIGEAYNLWYDDHSELGRWLRTKNAVEKIGDYVFCHGGISPMLADTKISLGEINQLTRQYLGKPEDDIEDSLARAVFDTHEGIFWYRAAAKNMLTEAEVSKIMNFAGAKRMVIGHTLVPDVTALYDGRVICIDLYHDENLRAGVVKTLYIEDGYLYSLTNKGEKSSVFAVAFRNKDEGAVGDRH